MIQNYDMIYYVAENVGIIGILAYPKTRHANRDPIIVYTIQYIYIHRERYHIKINAILTILTVLLKSN